MSTASAQVGDPRRGAFVVREVDMEGAPPRLARAEGVIVREGWVKSGTRVVYWTDDGRPHLAVWLGQESGLHRLQLLDGKQFSLRLQHFCPVLGIILETAPG